MKSVQQMEKLKMKVEVWSDIMCPFCYLGKHRFEKALEQFSYKQHVAVEWKSFQLMPDLQTDTSIKIHDFLSREKGIPVEQARQMNNQLTQTGRQMGLEYNFEKAVVANTFKSHILLHFAKTQRKQNEAKELLFEAYFTEGKNLDDINALMEVGEKLGFDKGALKAAFEDDKLKMEVKYDIQEARQLGVRGVPFFVFNRKYAVSGAQEVSVFLQTLEKSFDEWKKENPLSTIEIIEGQSCNTDGACD